ncbi:MAG: hypothetical protein ACK4WI_04290, partial [Microcystis sp.]|uniref:hypothetical protein n=1 Tax=Microcystis sp. TaxID=1127 RepID=UPI00391DE387
PTNYILPILFQEFTLILFLTISPDHGLLVFVHVILNQSLITGFSINPQKKCLKGLNIKRSKHSFIAIGG